MGFGYERDPPRVRSEQYGKRKMEDVNIKPECECITANQARVGSKVEKKGVYTV